MNNKKTAKGLASLGRNGDNTLVHMSKEEVKDLNTIGKAHGKTLSVNPDTGLPEAFDIGGALRFGANVAAAAAGVPVPVIIGTNVGFDTLTGQDLGTTALNAFSAYGGAKFGEGIKGFSVPEPTAFSGNVPTAEVVGGATGELGAFNAADQLGNTAFGSNIPSGAAAFNAGPGPQLAAQGQNLGGMQAGQNVNQLENFANFEAVQNQSPFIANLDSGIASTPVNSFMQGTNSGTQLANDVYSRSGMMSDPSKLSPYRNVRGFEAVANDPLGFAKEYGYGKTAMGLGGGLMAGLEQSDITPKLDMDKINTAGLYDPNRRLDLSMDTGLRLLAQGGKVEKFAEGNVVRDRSYYGINPQYQTVQPQFGSGMPYGGNAQQVRVPVMGFVDVGGKFVADPKGTMSDIDYEERFKYVTEGVAKPKDQDSSFESKAGLQGGVGMDPGVALNLAQGYADTQQADTAETGLGGLKKGGAIKYQQGGQTTAEMNMAKASTPAPATSIDMILAKKNKEEMAKQGMNQGGITGLTPDDGKMLNGMGDGVSDDIPAMIEGEQEAALSDGEFIVPARIVSELGNGSSDAGAQKLYAMIDRIQAARKQTIGDDKQYAKDTNAERYLPA